MKQRLGKHILLMIVLIFQSLILTGCVKDNDKEIKVPMNSIDFLVDKWDHTGGPLYRVTKKPQNGDVNITIETEGGGCIACRTYAYVYYTPEIDYIGTDKIEIQIEGFTLVTRTIEINVIGSNLTGNTKPIANDQNITIDYETPKDFNITGSDEDNDTITFVIESNTSNGTIVLVDEFTGKVTYTPNQDYNGTDNFTFKVIDENDASSNIADVNITVKSLCNMDPTAPGCPLDPCIINPTITPGCPGFDPCNIDPTAPGCPLDPCIFDPFSQECQDSIPV